MIVGIRVEAENFKQGIIKHTNSSYFTFVAIDKEENPVKVPGLELITDTEIRRFAFGKLRKEQKITNKKGFDELKAVINLKTVHQSWKKENCKVI
jgi:acyl-CoA hydrolase